MAEQIQEGFFGNLNDAQQKALSDIALPQVLGSKFEEAGLKGDDLFIWGVSLDAVGEKPDKKQSIVLLKFLRARNFVVDDAITMLVNCLKWRKEFGVKSIMDESFPKTLEEGGLLYGRDSKGCPVTYNLYGRMNFAEVLGAEDGKGLDRFLRWRVQLQERAIQLLDFENGIEQVMQIHDYDGASMFEMDAKMKEASSKVIHLFQDNYPEMLSAKLFLNVPWFMEMIFGIMSNFSDPKTRKKFSMVGEGNTRAALLEHIQPDQIPPQYGGFKAVSGKEATQTQSGVLRLRGGSPEEVTVEIESAGHVAWNFMTKKGSASVNATLVDGGGGGGGGEAGSAAGEHGGGQVEAAAAGARLVLKFENKEKGLLWVEDVEALFMVRVFV